MRLQGLYLSILGPLVVANVCWSASDLNSRLKLNGAEVLIDGSVHATGAVRADRYFEVINVSTPSTPPALHSRVFLSSESICAIFDNSSTTCFGSGVGTITGVTAGKGLTGGGTTGTVTLNVDPSTVTMQGNVFNGNSQLVQTNSSGFVSNSIIDGSSITKQGNSFTNHGVLFEQGNLLTTVGVGTANQVLLTGGSASDPAFGWTGLVVQSSQTIFIGTTVTSANFIGVQGSSITITPKSSTSKIKISGTMQFTTDSNAVRCVMTIARNGADLSSGSGFAAIQNNGTGVTTYMTEVPIGPYYDSPATTSATKYVVQVKSDGTHNCYGGNFTGSNTNVFIAEEIGQ